MGAVKSLSSVVLGGLMQVAGREEIVVVSAALERDVL